MQPSDLVSFRAPLGGGKTYAANYFVKHFGYTRISFADALKIELYDLFQNVTNDNLDVIGSFRKATGAEYPLPWFQGSRDPVSRQDKFDFINKRKSALRELMQWFGTEHRRTQNDRYWLERWQYEAEWLLSSGGSVVVDDARFDNEIRLISKMGGIHVYIYTPTEKRHNRLVERDGTASSGITGHASEDGAREDDPRNRFSINNSSNIEFFNSALNRLHETLVDDAA